MTAAHWALLFSGFALATSIGSFVWSIWKEFIFVKPRVDVGFSVMQGFGSASGIENICVLTTTNMGPGPVVLYLCWLRGSRGLLRRAQKAVINPIEGDPRQPSHEAHPFSGGLPATLEAGQQKAFYFPHVADSFLSKPEWTQIGVVDTFGRYHWCSKRAVRVAREKHQEDFPSD